MLVLVPVLDLVAVLALVLVVRLLVLVLLPILVLALVLPQQPGYPCLGVWSPMAPSWPGRSCCSSGLG